MFNLAEYFNFFLLSRTIRNVHRATEYNCHAYIPDWKEKDLSTDLNINLLLASLLMGAVTYPQASSMEKNANTDFISSLRGMDYKVTLKNLHRWENHPLILQWDLNLNLDVSWQRACIPIAQGKIAELLTLQNIQHGLIWDNQLLSNCKKWLQTEFITSEQAGNWRGFERSTPNLK